MIDRLKPTCDRCGVCGEAPLGEWWLFLGEPAECADNSAGLTLCPNCHKEFVVFMASEPDAQKRAEILTLGSVQ